MQLAKKTETRAERIREVGTDRVLFASDWAALAIVSAADYLRRWLPVRSEELEAIFRNRAAYLR